MQAAPVSPLRRAADRAALGAILRAAHWFTQHWLVVANTFFATMAFAAVLVPLSFALDLQEFGQALFDGLKISCHQMPSRSYTLFGFQLGMCHRMLAIFAAVALAGMVFAPFRHRLRPLSWTLLFFFAVPLMVDGFTQLFGWRESDAALRTITGALFAIGWVWAIYPWAHIHMLLMDRRLHDELGASGLQLAHR